MGRQDKLLPTTTGGVFAFLISIFRSESGPSVPGLETGAASALATYRRPEATSGAVPVGTPDAPVGAREHRLGSKENAGRQPTWLRRQNGQGNPPSPSAGKARQSSKIEAHTSLPTRHTTPTAV